MEIADILNQVDGERIYQHILKVQGTRHPLDAPKKLSETADYLHLEFERYGLVPRDQTFTVPGFDDTFRNIEGAVNNGDDAELLIVAHYDTVENCPGANDNASGVAVMLEAARVLAQQEIRNVRFIGLTLEELNPAFASKSRQMAQNLGLRDVQNRYTSLQVSEIMKKLFELQRKHWTMGKGPADALSAARTELETRMNESEITYVKQLEKMYEGITPTSWPGKNATMGSSFWVEKAVQTNKKVLGTLCFDTIGYTSEKEHSQRFPPGMKPDMFQATNISSADIGNFLAVVGDINSGKLVQSFSSQSAFDFVNLPCAALQVPFNYEQIASGMGDLLRSDHAPFWRQAIPALFMTDTADFRYPYYHTEADTIDKLDFSFMTKICKATIATAMHLTGREK
jgi:hypothetical protein